LRPTANRDDTIPPRVDEIIDSIAKRSHHYAQTNHGDNTILLRVDVIIGKSDTDTQFLTIFFTSCYNISIKGLWILALPRTPKFIGPACRWQCPSHYHCFRSQSQSKSKFEESVKIHRRIGYSSLFIGTHSAEVGGCDPLKGNGEGLGLTKR
jgi:hypothetical protein